MSEQLLLFPDNFRKNIVEIPGSTIKFLDDSLITLLTIDGENIRYNRDTFNDSYAEAAEKVFKLFKNYFGDYLKFDKSISWTFDDPEKRHYTKFFDISSKGINHNYVVDVWHHCFVQSLNCLIMYYVTTPH